MADSYMDFASTTPPLPEALAAHARVAAEVWGDPSRLYGRARSARIELDAARAAVAAAVGGRPEEIVFTSGGTEACNLGVRAACLAAAAARKPRRIIVSAVEHTAVLQSAHNLEADGEFEMAMVPVDSFGIVDLAMLKKECERGAGVVSIQRANHDVGTIQPVAEAVAIARAAGALFHTDACLAVGHVPVSVAELGVDLLSASSHKAYGPKGAGVLWARRGVRVRPLIVGDDRESRRRGGLQNLPAIAGMAAALTVRGAEIPDEVPRLMHLTTRLRNELASAVPGVVVHGHPQSRLPGLVAFSVPDIDGEATLLGLDAEGISVHSGSSCIADAQEPSHVLAAMGAPTHGAIRVSLGRTSTAADVDLLLDALPRVLAKLRR